MNDKSKEKDNVVFTWILEHSSCLLTIIFIVAVIGLVCSIVYEFWGYNIDWFPDVGTPADFCGVLGTMLAIFVTWQQIKASDERASQDRNDAQKQLKVAQNRYNTTIEEMRKEREETYRPDIYVSTEKIEFQPTEESFYQNLSKKKFNIINLGVGTAKNIDIIMSPKENSSLQEYRNILQEKWADNIDLKVKNFLFSKEKMDVDLPEKYLQIVQECIYQHIATTEEKIFELPKFVYSITYQDQEGIEYSKKLNINANYSDTSQHNNINIYVTFTFDSEPTQIINKRK